MWRLVFLALLIWLVIYIVKRIALGNHQTPAEDNKNTGKQSGSEDMVQCCTCQVHLPRSEAFLVNGKFYCSKAHIQDV